MWRTTTSGIGRGGCPCGSMGGGEMPDLGVDGSKEVGAGPGTLLASVVGHDDNHNRDGRLDLDEHGCRQYPSPRSQTLNLTPGVQPKLLESALKSSSSTTASESKTTSRSPR